MFSSLLSHLLSFCSSSCMTTVLGLLSRSTTNESTGRLVCRTQHVFWWCLTLGVSLSERVLTWEQAHQRICFTTPEPPTSWSTFSSWARGNTLVCGWWTKLWVLREALPVRIQLMMLRITISRSQTTWNLCWRYLRSSFSMPHSLKSLSIWKCRLWRVNIERACLMITGPLSSL